MFRARLDELLGEHAGRIPHVHAAGREPLELAGAAFDAVELLAHVEPGETRVSRLEVRKCPVRVDDLRVENRARAAATSALFVALRRWGTTANFMGQACSRRRAAWGSIR